MENKQPVAGIATSYVPEGQVLDGFLHEPQQAAPEQSVWIPALEAGTTLVVQTLHSRYHLEVLDPGRCTVILEGGSLFPEPAKVRLHGATAGGGQIKTGWIVPGLRIELVSSVYQGVITSPVESITIEHLS